MLAGHDTSSDGLTWKLTLRDGLLWHDGEKVLSRDCIASIQRWGKRDGFGQRLLSQTAEMKVVDDKSFEIRLTKPFPVLPYALGANGCFIMPERMAKTDAFTQITEYVGSGPFRFLKDEWVSGASAAWAKNEKYVPRQEPPSYWSGGKMVNFDRVEWKIMPDPATAQSAPADAARSTGGRTRCSTCCRCLQKAPGIKVEVLDPLGALGVIGVNHTQPPFDNPKLLQRDPAGAEPAGLSGRGARRAAAARPHSRASSSPARRYASDVEMERSSASAISLWPRSWWPKAAITASRSC